MGNDVGMLSEGCVEKRYRCGDLMDCPRQNDVGI